MSSEGPACDVCGTSEARCARLAIRCCGECCTHFAEPDAIVLPISRPTTPPRRVAPTPATKVELRVPYETFADLIDTPAGPLCAETDPEIFFPEKGGSTREAKAICGRCELRAECLETALTERIYFGIWGGLSQKERQRLAQSRGLPLAHNPYRSEPRVVAAEDIA